LFQLVMKARMATVTTPGSASGMAMRKKNPRRLMPSMAAASSISFGMARRKGTRMMTVVGRPNAICGTTMPIRLSTRPRSLTMM
jgi:hypothetical protein